MESVIDKNLGGKFRPIVMLHSDEKPDSAIQPKPGSHGCIMPYIAQVIAHGKIAVFDRDTCCCTGAVAGLGFGNGYSVTADHLDIFSAFFSKGLSVAKDREKYQAFVEKVNPREQRKFIEGERFFTSPERACRWITEELPIYNFPERYAIFKPLSHLIASEIPQAVTFTVNPLELTALITLAGSIHNGINMTITPQSAACQMLGAQVFRQAESERPCAVLGFLDLAARLFTRKMIPDEYFTYSVPWKLYLQLEEEAQDGIFCSPIWKDLQS